MVNRIVNRAAQSFIDLAALSIAFWLAFLARFEFELTLQIAKRAFFAWPYVVLFQYVVLTASGATRFAWRYVGLREITRFFSAIACANLCLGGVRLIGGLLVPHQPYAQYVIVPYGVIIINLTLAFMAIAGVRILRRLVAEHLETNRRRKHTAATPDIPTLLIGAGQAGLMVAKEILSRPELHLRAVGFIDDDRAKIGSVLHGIEVLGTSAEIPTIAEEKQVHQAIITIANAPGQAIRRLAAICDDANIKVKIIPGIYELIDGSVNLNRIRDVSVEDLLRREAVELDKELLQSFLTHKTVLVSGAGGSIGSEICRQIAAFEPQHLLLLERAEFFLYAIHAELTHKHPDLSIVPILCDINDTQRLQQVFAKYQPHVVFHAAAHKHVPMMELNPGEAIHNNVLGTKNLADTARDFSVNTFVLVSTDKAVNPTSIMGATKRVAERYIQALAEHATTKFCAVRFGNVMGSTGSVIPKFREQIQAGGPVTVTHPEMLRYFMTIPEASQLVMQAAAMGNDGDILVLDMGEPVKILDLAHDLIRLSGLEPDIDIPIVFSGPRPGEKLFEEFGFDAEKMDKTKHPKIYVGKSAPPPYDIINAQIQTLANFQHHCQREEVRQALKVIVPEMQPETTADGPAPRPKRRSLTASATKRTTARDAPASNRSS